MTVSFNTKSGPLTFLSNYSHTAPANPEQKNRHYDSLNETIAAAKGKVIIGGDFNARIYNVSPTETESIGSFILHREEGYVRDSLAPQSLENRQLFMETLKTHSLVAANTWFNKPNHELVTYKEKIHLDKNEADNGPPYDCTKFAQCDFLLTRKEDLKDITDLHSDVSCPLSDHLPSSAVSKLISIILNPQKMKRSPDTIGQIPNNGKIIMTRFSIRSLMPPPTRTGSSLSKMLLNATLLK